MPIEPSERVNFLNQIHLFTGLTEEQFRTVADELKEESFPAGKEIIKQGMEPDRLYLIWSGKVSVTRLGKQPLPATLVAGDHFGEEAMLVKHHKQLAGATAVEATIALVLTQAQFQNLVKLAPSLETNITVTINSFRLEQQVHFKWLQEKEVVYFLARKHSFLLLQSLIGPAILAFVSIVGMLLAWIVPVQSAVISRLLEQLWYVAMVAGLGSVGWAVWNGIDWSNDYYIITDQRVVWVEKVVGIYESRQEAPLSAVLRVNVETDLSGRLLDYGDLVISTIVGSTLKLRNVDHPYQAAALIDQYWKRSKQTSRKMEQEEIQNALRARLLEGQPKPPELKGIVAQPAQKNNPYEDQRGIVNLFRLRFENLATVTYRKHIFVLFEQTWKPGLILLILFGLLGYEIFSPTASFVTLFKASGGLLSLLWAILFVASVLWGIYEYMDWSNDIFQVTPDQIMDIDKTPLGQVTSDIASLDNILSIEYRRVGILELLFNFGTVFITIGGGREMTFENVFNPSAVQEDIERRRLEKITKKEQETIKAERERTADWFAAYYHNEQQLRREDGTLGVEKPDDTQPKNEVK
ncbi:MAG TPA: cyclic nucleotide-binding domain-containing protein [Anaerolineales bacterium]